MLEAVTEGVLTGCMIGCVDRVCCRRCLWVSQKICESVLGGLYPVMVSFHANLQNTTHLDAALGISHDRARQQQHGR